MATKWISPTWRMPEESNQSKFENYSLNFDGTNHISLTANSTTQPTTAFSLSLWAKWSAVSGLQGLISNGANNGYMIWSNGTTLQFYIYRASGGWATATSSVTLTADTWFHIAGTWDGSDISTIYVDGVSTGTQTGVTIPTYSGTPVVGKYISNEFSGNLTEVSIFDYELTDGTGGTENQIGDLYNSGTPVNPMALTPAPVAYYPLGGSSTGDAGTSPSTLTVPNESVPSATVFSYDDDKIDIPQVSLTNNNTISIWAKRDDISGADDRMMLLGSVDQYGYGCYFLENSTIYLQGSIGGAVAFSNAAIQTALARHDWVHWVFVKDSSSGTLAIYVDGDLAQSQSSAGGMDTLNTIGNRGDGGNINQYCWHGEISNTQAWDTNLSNSEITTLYNNGVPYTGTQPQAANLKAWYKLNVDTSTWDGNDWLLSNSGITPTYTTAVELPNSFQNPPAAWPGLTRSDTSWSGTDITLSFWVRYPNGHDGDINYIRASGISIGSIGSTNLQFGSGTYRNFPIGNLQNKAWHNVVVYIPNSSPTFLISDVRCFIDGSEVAGTNIGSGTASQITTISGWGANSGVGTSNLSNWTLFNSDLTGSISTLYNGGTPADVSSLNPVSWYKCDSTNVTFPSPGGSSMTFTDSSSNSNNATGAYDSDGFGGPFPSMTTTNVQAGDGTSSGMTTANLVTSDLTRSIPYSSYSMEFDGTDQYIDITNTDLGLNNTTSIWFKRSATGTHTLLGSGSGGSWNNYTIQIQSTGKIRYANEDINYVEFDNATTQSIINTTDTWINIIIIRSGADANLYVNSVDYDGTKTFSSGTTVATVVNTIAASGGASGGEKIFEFAGSLSNCSIYNSTLTQDQILTIYNGGVPNSVSSLSPVSWWSLAGDSYFDGTNWICPDLGSGGNNGTSANMAGTELVGDGPGSSANGVATSMDIPANLKGNAPNSSKNAFSVNMNSADRVEDVPA